MFCVVEVSGRRAAIRINGREKIVLASRAETDERSEEGIYEGLLIPFQKESNFCFKKEHRTARRSRCDKALRFCLFASFAMLNPQSFDSVSRSRRSVSPSLRMTQDGLLPQDCLTLLKGNPLLCVPLFRLRRNSPLLWRGQCIS